MNLSQCRMGEIVRETHVSSEHRIGHIMGLTANPSGEVIPLVRWACRDKEEGVHHGNLQTVAAFEREEHEKTLGDSPFD